MKDKVKFVNACPVFLVEDVQRSAGFYVNILGFTYAKHLDKNDKFIAIYRDSIEIILVEKIKGEIESNQSKYGNGYDTYINPDSIERVDKIYQEYKNKNVKIISEPSITDYGSYEFVIQDIDGRNLGIGLIKDKDKFFEKSNHL